MIATYSINQGFGAILGTGTAEHPGQRYNLRFVNGTVARFNRESPEIIAAVRRACVQPHDYLLGSTCSDRTERERLSGLTKSEKHE